MYEFKLSERRKWFVGLAIFIILVISFLMIFHASWYWGIGFILILTLIGMHDLIQKKHSILRNFPIIGHMRYILEFFRPEIQQYFVADDESEKPFSRETRTTIYRRAKKLNDTIAFGTQKNIEAPGYEWVNHSLSPKHHSEVEDRILIGSEQCLKPYSASRLNISAMSYGALSKNAVEALNIGASKGGFYQNTGEGGFTDYHKKGGDVVWQIGTAYFGCRTSDGKFDSKIFATKSIHSSIKMIEIKLSQGAKPSHGGVLPKEKLTQEIIDIRGVEPGVDVLSPPSHVMFDTPIGLCNFIKELRDLSGGKPVGFKLCIGKAHEFLGICKAMLKTGVFPDFITVDSGSGGTGAAPLEFINNMGMPLTHSLLFVHNSLVGCGIRDKITVIASGKVATGFDMVKLISLGADVCNSARAMMISIGCIQSRHCNNNTCPVGVATQNPRLYKALDIKDKSERVYNFHKATIKSFAEIIGATGHSNPSELAPSDICRQVDINTINTYDNIYNYIDNNCLIDNNIPSQFKSSWSLAKSESF